MPDSFEHWDTDRHCYPPEDGVIVIADNPALARIEAAKAFHFFSEQNPLLDSGMFEVVDIESLVTLKNVTVG